MWTENLRERQASMKVEIWEQDLKGIEARALGHIRMFFRFF